MAKRKYLVGGYLTISVTKEIVASSRAEALEKASALAAPGLCNQCSSSGEGTKGEWELNGFDDPPDDVCQYIDDDRVTDEERAQPKDDKHDGEKGTDYKLACTLCSHTESAPFAPGDACPMCGEPMNEVEKGGSGG